jgi:hypothetical protein
MAMHPESENDKSRYDKWLRKTAVLLEEIQDFEHHLERRKPNSKKSPST